MTTWEYHRVAGDYAVIPRIRFSGTVDPIGMSQTDDRGPYPATVKLSDETLRHIERHMGPRETWDEATRKAIGLDNE